MFVLLTGAARADIFATNAAIGALDTNYEGADIVISNCTVTVDGAHSFASLLITNGGVLTHSFFSNGVSSIIFNVTNEPQILSSTNPATLLNTNVSLPLVVKDLSGDTTYTNNADYVVVPQPDGTTQIQWTNTSAIADGATVLVSYSWSYVVQAGLHLTVTGDVAVANGGTINANGNGYVSGMGSGGGSTSAGSFADGSGAGYGGNGGNSSSNAIGGVCYGSVSQPTSLGSGGGASYAGSGGNGGGLIQIVAGGNVNLDGLILANGADATNSRAGGGAGGSVWISAASVSGSGSVTANGGAGEPIRGGGGGGGRIAIQCGTNNFSGTITAYGGSGWNTGGAGTIFTQLTGQNGFLLVDNGGRAGTNSTIALPSQTGVLICGNAGVIPSGSWSAGNLTIASNSALVALQQTAMNLNVNGTLTVQSGGLIKADGLGYPAGSGPGAGQVYYDGLNNPCSGGGHGGTGAVGSPANAAAGPSYDSQTSPASLGSGGGNYFPNSPGGSGGGAMNISVAGTLQVDGVISANGGNGSGTGGGGGSGGSIFINATSLAGSGSISANGGTGAGTIGGGGGGGRIAVISSFNTFTGTMNAAGGGGANWGGAGTIFQQQFSPSSHQLILDNAGHTGTNTLVQSLPTGNLIIRNGAIGTASSSATFASLTISSNAWMASLGPNYYNALSVTINGNATVQSGGGITADLDGSNPGIGSGPGNYYAGFLYPCSGAGHGGTGGNSVSSLALGGTAYDTVASPYSPGSGGGTYLPYSIGGNGGGEIQLTVHGTLQMDGSISANGGNGAGEGGGGASGGSINMNIGSLAGSGSITANGGNGVDAIGGGGGGGRIAIVFNNTAFAGAIAAYGGSGANFGGAGTIYLKTNSASYASVIVDNAGHVGANSSVPSSSTTDLTLRNGGFIYANSSFSLGNLIVSSHAWLVVSNASPPATMFLTVSGNVTVQPGGAINADATGYGANSGNGAGSYYGYYPYPGGGGGHGGYGASSISNNSASGGVGGYDYLYSPSSAGSGGGGYSTYSIGGSGGGVIQMSIGGSLQVDGSLSANGGNGSGSGAGGGAGGTLNLTVGTLSGTGSISANGGNGVNTIGGGGGGGMIAVNFTSNLFAGTVLACGGSGANYGGAGVICLKTNNNGQSVVIVDNAGHRGTNTPVSGINSSSGLILRNGAVAFQANLPQTVSSLLIAPNAWLMGNTAPGNNYPGIVNLTVTGNANIQSGGGIVTAAAGSAQNNGNGHGYSYGGLPWYQCSGAGHGGYGANSLSNSAAGGITYDSSTSPGTSGSGGGGYSTYSIGGGGGGYINFLVNGTLHLDGAISANGGNGSGFGGGGGSGGSIHLSPSLLVGSGSITANGGNGAMNFGGGGGGGRIAIYFNSNSFAGNTSAYGGGGANFGGAGTIYYKTNNQAYGLLVLDNANNAGTNTSFDFITMDVTIQNQAVGLLPSGGLWSPHNLLIHTNGVLACPSTPNPQNININANNITIDVGGIISMNGAGYGPQAGPGFGSASSGGGGHGGYGGGNGSSGGAVYDMIQSPTFGGSGGGGYNSGPSHSYGGAGGGALRLTATTLTVNGRLSANGLNGGLNAGGGSGGSLYLLNLLNLTGSGIISANGGAAVGSAGGGGGGRIALICTSNNFTGLLSAAGGNGLCPGGAGTIYTKASGIGTLFVDNGGITGTNTPLSSNYSLPPAPFNLNISGAATVVPLTPLPLLSNLTINAGSTLTMPGAQSNLVVAVLKDFNLTGSLNVDDEGYPQTNGPGAGSAIASEGSGGGYGGAGGNSSSGAPGGTNYGSATQPVDFGSGGGNGQNTITGGSDGGGALRISVGGTLNVNGNISANGNSGWQDDSGGGAGGSIWITANTLAGTGNISASGGDGVLYGGGGGGGGRIAIYSPTNHFAGTTNASGGSGASPGQPGTVFLSSIFAGFQIIFQSPAGFASNIVSSVVLNFNEAIDPTSISSATFTLTTPAGPLPAASVSAAIIGSATVQVSFPAQNLLGDYSIQVATTITNIFGQPLATPYTGGFTIVLPTISGSVTDTNGAPVAGVLLQPDGGLISVTTDTNGNYSLGVPPGWNGTVTPALGSFMFVPASLAYTNVTGSLTNQNYLMVPTIAPQLAGSLSGTIISLNWPGTPGVTYQLMWSTNLVDWQTFGGTLPGTNGPMQIILPLGTDPAAFFRLSATD
jgi:hypothetical protein